jgi:Glycerol-3-phosphate dehydrogenase
MIVFNREDQLKQLEKVSKWDIIVIGGGSTGLGIAVDAASRGYRILLLEQSDFSKGTSSRSTKLVHGGVRYLEQGNIGLVYTALKERGLLLKNAPHLVHKQSFIIPCYSFWDKVKYMTGLKMYDWLSGRLSFGKSVWVSKKEINECLDSLNKKKLIGGIKYFDGQFDDSRLAISLARTAVEHGAVALNYFKVTDLIKAPDGKIEGVHAVDVEKDKKYGFYSKLVINATGVFADDILKLDEKDAPPLLTPSQGIHIVVSKRFLSGPDALMIPETKDGRVLFAVPWHEHILIGTTDTPVQKTVLEPQALKSEVEFILETVKNYLQTPPVASDILSIFAGLRPLVISHKKNKSTKELSRDHKIFIHPSGLYTITGGKWTTYRKMAEDILNTSIKKEVLHPKKCITARLPIHGSNSSKKYSDYSIYGSDADHILELINKNPELKKILVAGFHFTEAEVVWSIRFEMARTIEDILARRLRILFLNARLAMEAAPRTGEILKQELKKDDHWLELQLEEFYELAKRYLYKSS